MDCGAREVCSGRVCDEWPAVGGSAVGGYAVARSAVGRSAMDAHPSPLPSFSSTSHQMKHETQSYPSDSEGSETRVFGWTMVGRLGFLRRCFSV